MNTNTKTISLIAVAAVVLLVAGAIMIVRVKETHQTPVSQTTSTTASSSVPLGGIQASGGYTIHEVTPAPQGMRDMSAVLASASAAETKGDYAGAERILISATQTWPADVTPYNNLADLYLHDIKNYQKAAQEYLKVVQLDPHNINAYTMLFAIYSENLYTPSPSAAVDILKQAIAKNPKNVQMQIMLARYYKSQGNTADAKSEYSAAIANAQSQGQTDLAAQIQQESAGL